MPILQAKLVDLHQRRIYPARVTVSEGYIQRIEEVPGADFAGYLMPGFVDAHIHIESSMLPPSEFARLAVVHGTVATVSDPHEIANVLGEEGVHFMLADARRVPFTFCFGAPSCVPATSFETAGATLDTAAVTRLLAQEEIGYLAEMMNFPGVLHEDQHVLAKLAAAQALGKPIDGHAPGLRGEDAQRYFAAGISTDHECFTYEEGREKAELGVKILIREGSAARNFAALWPLLHEFPEQVMFCSDDKHPDDLIQGHINQLAARAIAQGCELFTVLRAACVHPVAHYTLPVGLLREGDPADFIEVDNLTDFRVKRTWLRGELVAEAGKTLLPHLATTTPNQLCARSKRPEEFHVRVQSSAAAVRAIEVFDGEIVTGRQLRQTLIKDGLRLASPAQDVVKIAVVNRYAEQAVPAVGFVCNTGLQSGALASSVAHDSHNIVAIGVDDESLCRAVNAIIEAGGGISAVDESGRVKVLPLPIAGLMSTLDGYTLAADYTAIDHWVKAALGCSLRAPFMTLSFLALPVIPALKMTDLGLFDVDDFGFVELEV
jgi:adenine deaminase